MKGPIAEREERKSCRYKNTRSKPADEGKVGRSDSRFGRLLNVRIANLFTTCVRILNEEPSSSLTLVYGTSVPV